LHYLVFLKVLFWDLCCSVYTLMIYTAKLTIPVLVFLLMI
jgi:hypothetical protein